MYLRQSTASQQIQLGPFFDPADFDTPKNALTIANTDIRLFKDGATTKVAKHSGGATFMELGSYYCVLDATDTNTVGKLVIDSHPAGATAYQVEFTVLPQNVYDSFVAGTSQVTEASIAAEVVIEMDADSTKLSDILAGVTALPADIGTVIVDGAITRDQLWKLAIAVLGGDAAGLLGNTKVFKDQSGATLVSAAFTGNGNTRTVTLTF